MAKNQNFAPDILFALSNNVHDLLLVCQRDVYNEVESFLSFVEHVGHGHGEDVVHGFDGTTMPLAPVTILRSSITFSNASCEIWSGLIFPILATATVVENMRTLSCQSEDICWIFVQEEAWSTW